MKRFTLYYTSDRHVPNSRIGEYLHNYGRASNITTIKQYVSRVKRECAADNPRDFFYTDRNLDEPLAIENRHYL